MQTEEHTDNLTKSLARALVAQAALNVFTQDRKVRYYLLDIEGPGPKLEGPFTERNLFLARCDEVIERQQADASAPLAFALEIDPDGTLHVWDSIPEEGDI